MLLAMSEVDAQVTKNIRVGGGINVKEYGATALFQMNIPLKENSLFVISPTIQLYEPFDEDLGSQSAIVPVYIGYRKKFDTGFIFIPKIDPALGFNIGGGFEGNFVCGPSVEQAFEKGHFCFGINAFYSLNKVDENEARRSYYDESIDIERENIYDIIYNRIQILK